jgi:hypothetical protein
MRRPPNQTSANSAIVLIALLAGVGVASAAPLSYSNDTYIYLSSPQITLTIQSGSAADSLVVNATSIAITISSSTGGTFTLTSPQALSLSTAGSGGTDDQSCSSGIETDYIAQTRNSETYTLTPTGSACAQQSQTGGGGVSVGGGGSSYSLAIDNGATSTATTSVTLSLYGTGAYTMEVSNDQAFASSTWMPYAATMPWTLAPNLGNDIVYAQFRSVGGTVIGNAQASINLVSASSSKIDLTSLAAELQSLEAQLAALEAQANGTTSLSPSAPASSLAVPPDDLQLWDEGVYVNDLQQILIAQGIGPWAARLKAHGTTRTFGLITYHALAEFQAANGISATGYYGRLTRAKMKALLGE